MSEVETITDELNYVARCPKCKCIRAASKAPPDPKSIADWIRRGYSVERATNEEVKGGNWVHKCRDLQPELFA